MEELLNELREHERDYPELIHGPLCGQAADTIDRITAERDGYKAALELITVVEGSGEYSERLLDTIQVMRETARAALAVPDADGGSR